MKTYTVDDDGWRISDELWTHIAPLLPPGKPHPLGCHRKPVDPRRAMDAIFFVLRTGCQWNALNATGICHSSSAHRAFQRWTQAGVFRRLWERGLLEYDGQHGIQWRWQAMDGALTKAPLAGEKNRAESHRSRENGHQTQYSDRGRGRAPRGRGRRSEPAGLPVG